MSELQRMTKAEAARKVAQSRQAANLDKLRLAWKDISKGRALPTNKQLSDKSGLSIRTCETYRSGIMAEVADPEAIHHDPTLADAFACLLRIPARSRDPDLVRAYEMLGFTIPEPPQEAPRQSLFRENCPFALLRTMPPADARKLLEAASAAYGQVMNPEVEVGDAVADLEHAFGYEESAMNAIACELVILVEEHVKRKAVKPPMLNPNPRRRSA